MTSQSASYPFWVLKCAMTLRLHQGAANDSYARSLDRSVRSKQAACFRDAGAELVVHGCLLHGCGPVCDRAHLVLSIISRP